MRVGMMVKVALRFAALAGLVALASCTTAPPPPPPAPIVVQPRSVAPPTNYRWTNGFSEKGYEAMYAAFGKVRLRPGEFHWTPNVPVDGNVAITVDIANQIAFVFKG